MLYDRIKLLTIGCKNDTKGWVHIDDYLYVFIKILKHFDIFEIGELKNSNKEVIFPYLIDERKIKTVFTNIF